MPDRPVAADSRIKELKKRLEADPRSRVFLDLAKAHQRAGETAEAVRVCREGLEKQPGYHSARVLLGKLLLEAGDHGQAMEELQMVVAQAPDNLLARRLLGSAQEGAGRSAEALETYRSLLSLQPGEQGIEAKIASLESSGAAGREELPPAVAEPDRPEPEAGPVPQAVAGPSGEGTEAELRPPSAAEAPEAGGETLNARGAPTEEVETLDMRQDVEVEPAGEASLPPEEPPPGPPDQDSRIGPTETGDSHPPDMPHLQPEPEVRESPAEDSGFASPGGMDVSLQQDDETHRGAMDAPAGGEEVPRTVALDPSELSLVEDTEDRPTEVMQFADLPATLETAGAEPGDREPSAASPAPSPEAEPAPREPLPEEAPPPGASVEPAADAPEAPEAAGDEARTVMISAPAFDEAVPAGPGDAPGDAPSAPEPGTGLPRVPESEAHEDALPTPTLAELYIEQGMPQKAVAVYQRILEGDPDNAEIRRRLNELEAGPAPEESPALAKIRALQGWLERIKRSHDAQSGP